MDRLSVVGYGETYGGCETEDIDTHVGKDAQPGKETDESLISVGISG